MLSLVLSLAWPLQALAERADDMPDLAEVRAQQVELRGMVEQKQDVFAEWSDVRRAELMARQDRLLAKLAGVESFHDLDKRAQFEVFNELEWINATVNDARGAQVVCEYVEKTGSRRKIKECKTVAQRDAEREESQDSLRDLRETGGMRNN
jgi:hypothetical protein